MENGLKKKYGLFTAIAMVVGIVVGSGVFFKAEKVLTATGGNLKLGILSWIIGGAIMVSCAYVFSLLATKIEKVNGVVDYAEATVGDKYAYLIGWFLSTIYYPTLTMALSWVSARYTLVLIYGSDADITGGLCLAISAAYLIASFALNSLAPVIAGKFQVTTTAIKLIPLLLMAIIGTIYGLTKGYTVENFTTVVEKVVPGSAIFKAVCATAFAYEGWIIATSINAEIKDSKKNLPRALVIGTLTVVAIYVVYYIGLAGAIPNAEMMAGGEAGARHAFSAVFGNIAGTGLFVFVVVSCLGTLNGLMLGCTRGMYSIAIRNRGPKPEVFKQIDPATNMPTNSSVFGLLLCGIWLLYFYCAQLSSFSAKMGTFAFDPTEIPIITIYAFYVPMFIMILAKHRDGNVFQKFVAPVIALFGCLFMIVAAFVSHKATMPGYLIIFVVVMLLGVLFMNERPAKKVK